MKILILHYFAILGALAGVLGGLANCAKPGESEKSSSGAPAAASSQDSAPQSNEQSSDAVVQGPANLQMAIVGAANFQDFRVQVVGSETSYQLSPVNSKPGSFELSPALTGEHDLLIFADSKPQGNNPKVPYGLRLSGLNIPQGKGLVLPQIQLSPSFALTGKVLLQTPASVTIEVLLKGTGLKATVDTQGNFTIPGVPVGSHELSYSASGYSPGSIARSPYSSTTTLPNITLFAESKVLSEGISYHGQPLAKDIAVRVTFALKPPTSDYDSMRIGLDDELDSANWQSLRSSIDLNLKEQVRTVYVQFSREGRQPSRVYSVLIPSP